MTSLAVIMSVYFEDELRFVEQSVQSILNQTYSDYHFYIVFDGPVSLEIESYFLTLDDDRIRHFRIKKNGGLATALNFLLEKILEEPGYKFIARMDADDISGDTRFEKQYSSLLANPGVSCIGTWYQEVDENGTVLSSRKLPVDHEQIMQFSMKRSPFAHPSVMFRREMIEKAGLYPTNTIRLEDLLFWSNALNCGCVFANIPEFLLQFRIDKDFYKRRSGIMYGLNYIITRFKINKVLKAPVYIYLYSIGVGLIRMMPVFILRFCYLTIRKHNN